MSDEYKVVRDDGKVVFTGTQDDCDEFAMYNAQHGTVVPA